MPVASGVFAGGYLLGYFCGFFQVRRKTFSLRLRKHNLEDYATKMHNLEDDATKMATCVSSYYQYSEELYPQVFGATLESPVLTAFSH